MKLPLIYDRTTAASRDLRGGCFVCWGSDARWTSANAQALAAQHHDRTGHTTWCDIYLSVRYGRDADDDRQHDIEDTLKVLGASASLGGEPDAAPLPVPDAPAVPAAGVSAPESRSSRSALAADSRSNAHV